MLMCLGTALKEGLSPGMLVSLMLDTVSHS